jgi:hypothetical protein
MPGWAIACSEALLLVGGSIYLKKFVLPSVAFESAPFSGSTIVGAGIISWVMVVSSASHTVPLGGWDAWAIWNLQSKYLADGSHWQNMFLNVRHGHPDYPLLVPGIGAMFVRMFSGVNVELPAFFWSMCMAIIVPVLLWLALRPKGLLVPVWAVYVVISSPYYLAQAAAMYADVSLAVFLLGAILSLKLLPKGDIQVLLTALCLGCCVWTKNEGSILAGLFVAFHFRTLLFQKRWLMLFAGLSLPLVAWVVLKGVYAPANDLAQGLSAASLHQLVNWQRYSTIWNHVSVTVSNQFGYMRWVVVVYLLLCLFRKRWPGVTVWMLAISMVVYFFIYVLSPMDLEWHLITSADRLMLQLMPSLMYVLVDEGLGSRSPTMPRNIFFNRFTMSG